MAGLEEFGGGWKQYHPSEGGILHERRIFLQLTQKEVAERADIPLHSYECFENNERKLSTASFRIACSVLEALEMDITKFYHNDYALGEDTYFDKDGRQRFVETDATVDENVTEESEEMK